MNAAIVIRYSRFAVVGLTGASSRFLNISSMRSVTTKPPTTFAVASTTATNETRRMKSPGWGAPMTMIAPTITIPWIAFVPDMSGVCSSVGTFEITSNRRRRRARES